MTSVLKNFAYDDAVPQRERLLDPNFAARYFGQFGKVNSCERLRVKYRIGQNLRVTYKVDLNGKPQIVACRTFSNGCLQKAQSVVTTEKSNSDGFPSAFYNPDLQAMFWAFPSDRKIKGLEKIENPNDPNLPEWKKSKLVAYAPEKCATFQCLDRNGNVIAYVKVYGDVDAHKIFDLYKYLEDAPFRTPRAISHTNNELIIEAVGGVNISELSAKARFAAIKKLGENLALVHTYPPPKNSRKFGRFELASLKRSASVIGAVRPDVNKLLERLIAALCSFQPASKENVFLHGDVHTKNVLVDGGELCLIDFDQAGLGSRAADIGSFLALTRYSRITEAITDHEEKMQVSKFLNGYSGIAGMPEMSILRWHIAAGLLAERALRAVNRIRPEALAKLKEILEEAIEIVEGRSRI